MDEYIDIVDENGRFTGQTVLKSEAHLNGWFHNTIHVWLYAPNGDILLSQRSAQKIIFPLLWDVSAAGHVDSGESIANAAKRETLEELGLELSDQELKPVGVYKHLSTYDDGRIKDYEFHYAHIAPLKVELNNLVLQEGEVDAVKLVSHNQFIELLEGSPDNMHFVPSNGNYYKLILEQVAKAVKN
ncbi:MAG: NUDIX domain-containing protein [Flavobacteriaceae bacterium]|nr:NUDIX domain-containing protein [Flavobacteriaceae bacterium]